MRQKCNVNSRLNAQEFYVFLDSYHGIPCWKSQHFLVIKCILFSLMLTAVFPNAQFIPKTALHMPLKMHTHIFYMGSNNNK